MLSACGCPQIVSTSVCGRAGGAGGGGGLQQPRSSAGF